jgi:hypothetical protein
MERLIARFSYWMGLVCVVMAVCLRGLNLIGILRPSHLEAGITIWYMSFFKGALLFLLLAIAAANYAWLTEPKA